MQFFQSCLCEQNVPLTLPRQCALAVASAGAAFGRAKIASGDFFTPSTLKGRGDFSGVFAAFVRATGSTVRLR
jgi:hypothetical protein